MAWARLTERQCIKCGGNWFIRPAYPSMAKAPGDLRGVSPHPIKNKETVCPSCRGGKRLPEGGAQDEQERLDD